VIVLTPPVPDVLEGKRERSTEGKKKKTIGVQNTSSQVLKPNKLIPAGSLLTEVLGSM
jgi:hypothetical protein